MTDETRQDRRQGPFDFKSLFGHLHASDTGPTGVPNEGQPGAEEERCRRMAEEVQWEAPIYANNILRPCRGEIEFPPCRPVELPQLRPRVYVFWGASQCDCIEGDDTEIMTVLVYNPYSNVTLSNVEINRITVVNADGTPVPNLPDGSPAIQLVPRGVHCFGTVLPCRFAFRQFVLRLRGAPPGPYRILIQGICFEVCLHRLVDECVMFDVCRD